MTRGIPALIVELLGLPVAATADELRVNQLEAEVRELKRNVLTLQRQIDELQRVRPDRPAARDVESPPAPSSTTWIDAAKWQKVRTGMSELEVLTLLGPPTSMRETGGTRLLFYALEIQPGSFLGGSVTVRDRAVVEFRKPELR
jgi:hypothetical protein